MICCPSSSSVIVPVAVARPSDAPADGLTAVRVTSKVSSSSFSSSCRVATRIVCLRVEPNATVPPVTAV